MLCSQYSCEVGFQPRCDKGEDVILPLVTSQFCSQEVRRGDRWVTVQVKPKCDNNKLVTMVREDRGFTCRKGEGGIHRPGGLPLGVRRWPVCKEGDELCKEFQNKCYFIINGCGEKWMVGMHSGRAGGLGGWRNFLLKNLESKKNNRIKINDWSAYMKKRRQWWLGLD